MITPDQVLPQSNREVFFRTGSQFPRDLEVDRWIARILHDLKNPPKGRKRRTIIAKTMCRISRWIIWEFTSLEGINRIQAGEASIALGKACDEFTQDQDTAIVRCRKLILERNQRLDSQLAKDEGISTQQDNDALRLQYGKSTSATRRAK